MRGEAANLTAVQDVKRPQLLDRLLAEAAQRKVNDLPAGKSARSRRIPGPGGAAQQGDMSFLTVIEPGRNQAFFERVREIESPVVPDVADRAGRKEKHGPAVSGRRDSRSHDVFREIAGEKRQCRFVVVLGMPL